MRRYMMAKKGNTALRVVMIILVVLLSLVLVAGIGVTIVYKAQVEPLLNQMNRVDYSTYPTLSSSEAQEILDQVGVPEQTDPTAEPTEPFKPVTSIPDNQHVINVLLVGQDQRGKGEAKLSDTMILCTINKKNKTVVLTSFLRDMYVKLPDYGTMKCGRNRINVNYALGGMGMLDQCLYENFGITVDHNIEVNFAAFRNIVDTMGGVDIMLTKQEADHLDGKYPHLVPGMNHLNGEEALDYARIRKIDNDFYRTDRQRKVMTALFEKCKSLSVGELRDLAYEFLPMVTTDMSNSDIISYVAEILPIVTEMRITTQAIPIEGAYSYADKGTATNPMYVIIPDLEANRKYLAETIG